MAIQLATIGAGCFWGVEYLYNKLEGVLKTEVGYMGGDSKNPTYREVCTGKTGHAEVVQITFDDQMISYQQIIGYFWRLHDPTTLNRQGVDVGTQYRSIIFTHDENQNRIAHASKKSFDKSGVFDRPAVTQIVEASTFWKAEEYHQDYFQRNGGAVCHVLRER